MRIIIIYKNIYIPTGGIKSIISVFFSIKREYMNIDEASEYFAKSTVEVV
ncbi:hypothetical protein [Clostridium sp. Cult3]|nr:hypothetical protein [Clostridium sp. Cult3]